MNDGDKPDTGDGEPGGAPDQDERNLGMLCHLLALAGLAIPLGNVLAPLVLWVVKKDDSPFVDAQGREALNFNITMALAGFVSSLLMVVGIGFVLIVVVALFWLVMTVIAASRASSGELYHYPLTLRLVQ